MAGRLRTIRDLLALLVTVTLVGAVVVGAVGSDRATAATTTTHRVTIPATAFRPMVDSQAYSNFGIDLVGQGKYLAPVSFYRPGDKVRVMNMSLFATDNRADAICANLLLGTPSSRATRSMGEACSTGAAPGVRRFQVRFPAPRSVTEFQGVYVAVQIDADAPSDLMFHAVRITYRVTE